MKVIIREMTVTWLVRFWKWLQFDFHFNLCILPLYPWARQFTQPMYVYIAVIGLFGGGQMSVSLPQGNSG